MSGKSGSFVIKKFFKIAYRTMHLLPFCFAFVFLFASVQPALAQNDYLDQTPYPILKQRLDNSSGANRVDLLLEYSFDYIFKLPAARNLDTAYSYLQEATKLSKRLGYLHGQGNSMLIAGFIFNKQKQADRGFSMAKQALALFTRSQDFRGMGDAYILIGQHYDFNDSNGLLQRIANYKKAVSIFAKGDITLREATTLKDLGDLYFANVKYQDALISLHHSLKLYQAIGYKKIQLVYELLGGSSVHLDDYTNGIRYELLAMKTARDLGDSTLELGKIYILTGICYHSLKDYPNALKYFSNAYRIASNCHDSTFMDFALSNKAVTLNDLGRYKEVNTLLHYLGENFKAYDPIGVSNEYILLYLHLHQLDQARPYAERLINYVDLKTSTDTGSLKKFIGTLIMYELGLKNYNKSYYYISRLRSLAADNDKKYRSLTEHFWFQLDSAKGNFTAALTHYERSDSLTNALFNEIKSRQIAVLKIEYESDQKDQNIELLYREEQLKDSSLTKTANARNLLSALTLLLVITIMLGINRYRLKLRSNRELETKQIEINKYNKQLQSLLKEKDHLINDKDLLLKEVHHRVKNNLQIVMSLLESQTAFLNNDAAIDAILESQNRVQAIALIHQKLYAEENITQVDMQNYIPDLINYLTHTYSTVKKGITIKNAIPPVKLDVSQAIPIGIILNEAITNSIKHAFSVEKGESISVEMKLLENDIVFLSISDNGIGFPTSLNNANLKSLGMTLIRGLSFQLDGTLSIDGKNGVNITIEFPLQYKTVS